MTKTKVTAICKENRESRGEGKPETFNFLGFTLYCSEDSRKGFFRVKVKTSRKKAVAKIKKLNEWLKKNRHYAVKDIIKRINQSLMGHYHYYGVTDNTKSLEQFKNMVMVLLFKWLNRRSQRLSYTWNDFKNRLLVTFPIAQPKVYVSLFYR